MATPRVAFETSAGHKLLRKCQHCSNLDTVEQPLLSCACKQSRYCNKECQKADWKSHKAFCKQIREFQSKHTADRINDHGLSDGDGHELSKKWVKIKKDLLGVSVIDALHLQSFPEHMDTHLLSVVLSPTFPKGKVPKSNDEIAQAFSLENAQAVPLELASVIHPQMEEVMSTSFKVNREKNKEYRRQGGDIVGTATVIVTIPVLNLARIVPWIVQRVQLDDRNENWETLLRALVPLGSEMMAKLR